MTTFRHSPESEARSAKAGLELALSEMRQACQSSGGGCAVLRAIQHCALHDLSMPQWLRVEYVRRYSLVGDAHVGSWDEAFDRPYPKRANMAWIRRRRDLRKQVHEAVWAKLRDDIHCAIDAHLFADVGSALAISGSSVRNYYYKAINEGGLVNLSDWKAAMLRCERASHSCPQLTQPLPMFAPERLNSVPRRSRRA